METLLNLPLSLFLFLTLYFEVFLLVTYFEEKEHFLHKDAARRPDHLCPSATIIVPAWNEEKTLERTVTSLLQLDYPKDKLRIFIVDDGSTDGTLLAAQAFAHHPEVRIFSKENGGKYTALNLGIDNTDSALIGCLDADSFVASNALREIIPYFDDPKIMAVTPSVQIAEPKSIIGHLQATEYMIGEFTRKIFSRLNALYVTPGPFSIYRREVFTALGGFVHGYNTEDMEMALRMQANHMKIENAHGALVYTFSPGTLLGLYKQRVRWVSGFLKNAFFDYRRLFFTRKYGNLGLLTMPFAALSIFIALFFTGVLVRSITESLYQKYLEYSALGFSLSFRMPTFDWFTLNLEFRHLVIYFLLSLTICFLLFGARIVLKRVVFSVGMLYFILLYGLIAPLWLFKSVYNLVTAKEATWR